MKGQYEEAEEIDVIERSFRLVRHCCRSRWLMAS
jgi:hypothetical protein